jgi:hypothetical protein
MCLCPAVRQHRLYPLVSALLHSVTTFLIQMMGVLPTRVAAAAAAAVAAVVAVAVVAPAVAGA